MHLRRTDSTNERARQLALAGAPHGMLVTSAEQTDGRGRQGRRWSAPPGSAILMSLLLRATHPATRPDADAGAAAGGREGPPVLLPLMAAVAVCDVVGERAQIKWPNDVVEERDAPAGGRGALGKLAGILIEGRPQHGWLVLGIGLNVAVRVEDLPPELRPDVAGTAEADAARDDQRAGEERGRGSAGLPAATLGRAPSEVEPMLARLLDALERRLAEPPETTLAAWRARDALRGREIAWSGGRGRADGIDGTGRLVVALADGGRTALGAGEVHLQAIG